MPSTGRFRIHDLALETFPFQAGCLTIKETIHPGSEPLPPGFSQVRVNGHLRSHAKKDLWWHPHSAKVYKGMLSILRLVAGPGLGTRLGAALNVVLLFFRYWNRD